MCGPIDDLKRKAAMEKFEENFRKAYDEAFPSPRILAEDECTPSPILTKLMEGNASSWVN